MIEEYRHLLEFGAGIIEAFAAAVIIGAFFWALYVYFRGWRTTDREQGFQRLREDLGRALLVALEILVVADVIDTIATEATAKSLAVLSLLVLLRTLLSWSLSLQVEGRWPWQPEPEQVKSDG